MSRTVRTQALVLKVDPFGEAHRLGTLLTQDQGLLTAAFFGAASPRGRLHALAEAPRHLEVWLYRQPVRDLWKVNEAEEVQPLEGLRGSVERFHAAHMWAELVRKTQAGGDPDAAFGLLLEALLILDAWPPQEVRALNLQFCLKWLEFCGLDSVGGDPAVGEDGGPIRAWCRQAVHLDWGQAPEADWEALEAWFFPRLEAAVGRPILSIRGWQGMMGGKAMRGADHEGG